MTDTLNQRWAGPLARWLAAASLLSALGAAQADTVDARCDIYPRTGWCGVFSFIG